jgi:hypothetical protein
MSTLVLVALVPVSACTVRAQAEQPQPQPTPQEAQTYHDAPTLIDWTPEQIHTRPELRNLQLAETQAGLPAILDEVGKRVAAFFDEFPNTTSTEDVQSGPCSTDSEMCMGTYGAKFQYRLVWHSAEGQRVLTENRADKKGRPVDSIEIMTDGRQSAPMLTYGFTAAPLLHFYWQNRATSRFRYFGRQMVDGKATDVVGFAEIPEEYYCPTKLDVGNREAAVSVQGVAWIDASTYQILRIQSDLLAPSKVGLERLTTRIDYSATQLSATSTAFWLPSQAVVDIWFHEMSTYRRQPVLVRFRNIHRYSHYEPLRVESPVSPTLRAQTEESQPPSTPPEARPDAPAQTLLDWTPEQIRRRPELRKLQPAESQQDLPAILREVGDRVASFFSAFPDTTSTEEVQSGPCSPVRENCALTFKAKYQYLLIGRYAEGERVLDEYRADKKGRPIDYQPDTQRLARVPILTSGFAAAPLLHFHPQNRTASRFRYFGRQRVRGEKADVVVGFAEIPGKYCCPTKYGFKDREVTLIVQGLAWIDATTYQILRIQTQLVVPQLEAGLERQTTRIDYSAIQLPETSTAFWLPTRVVVDIWIRQGVRRVRIRNIHRYSHYKLFRVESRISPVVEK